MRILHQNLAHSIDRHRGETDQCNVEDLVDILFCLSFQSKCRNRIKQESCLPLQNAADESIFCVMFYTIYPNGSEAAKAETAAALLLCQPKR